MPANAFIGRKTPPSRDDLSVALGSSQTLWDGLLEMLAREFGLAQGEWNSYSPKAGWSYRVQQKKRNIVYFGPCAGSFRVALVLGDKALNFARENGLPKRVDDMIAAEKKYPEGTPVRLAIKSARDFAVVKKLVAAKLVF